VGFDHSYSFIFSARPGTPAASMEDDVPMTVKKAHLQQVQELIKSQAKAITESMSGTRQRVLVEGKDNKKEGFLKGKTDNSRGIVFEGDESLIGQIVWVDVTTTQSYMLNGILAKND
jgi:tRNA-2-methylthio-N6-dimethylallyladenosine synthase